MDISLNPTRYDYYRMLGLEPSAPIEAVRDLYHILARRLHPDVSGDPAASVVMSRLNSAVQQLIGRPVPSDFTIDPTPVLRRANSADEPLARYREAMSGGGPGLGRLVDVAA